MKNGIRRELILMPTLVYRFCLDSKKCANVLFRATKSGEVDGLGRSWYEETNCLDSEFKEGRVIDSRFKVTLSETTSVKYSSLRSKNMKKTCLARSVLNRRQ